MQYFKFFFSLLSSELYPFQAKREFTEFEALIDLLVMGKKKLGCIEITAGELGERWKWQRMKVNRFLSKLDGGFIRKGAEGNKHTYIYINNFERLYDIPTNPKVQAEKVIELFNTIMGKEHTVSQARIELIAARIKDGHDMPQFEAVFKHQKEQWENDPEMAKYLVIETLCRKSKFPKYLDAAREAWKKKNKTQGKFVTTREFTN